MRKIYDKKAQQTIGTAMAAAVATIAIALIILLFALASTLFTPKKHVGLIEDFSMERQAEISLIYLMQSKEENIPISDMLRISKNNPEYEEKVKTIMGKLNQIYPSWAFSSTSGISLNTVASQKGLSKLLIPDSKQNIELFLGVTNDE